MFSFLLELDEFLQDLDEDVEGMQSTIYLLQNELQKYKSQQITINTENKGTNSTSFVNGIKKDDVITKNSTTDMPTQLVENLETKSDNKLNKHDKIKDLKHINDNNNPQSKNKKTRLLIVDGTEKNSKVHKSKHKSDISKNDERHKKSEKKVHNKVVHKKSKSEQPKSTQVKILAAAVVNGIPNGS